MNIQSNHVVALTYDLYTIADGQETFVEQANEDNPLVFLFGTGTMLPKFEENLSGLETGADYDFELPAVHAYGEKDPEAVASLPLEMFEGADLPAIGSVLPLQDNNGHQFSARVEQIDDQAVTVDLNHPMAGRHLHFKGKILNVRPATPDELAHGHAHGADGHGGH